MYTNLSFTIAVKAQKYFPFNYFTRNKSFYVTTPIFYVNAAPHIGHLYTATIADAACRWKNLKNNENAKLVTGTDEHGLKVLQAAKQSQLPVVDYCNKISKRFQEMFSTYNIDYFDFIRTTEQRHLLAVDAFWNALSKNEYIYKGTYEGWYCTSDEAFVSPMDIVEVRDEKYGVYHVHAETKNRVEWTKESNYKFKLSLFRDKIREWILNNPNVIQPDATRQNVMSYLDEELPDLSVSRDKKRVSWGINVPNDPSQIIYVWLDALVNYLTACGYPDTSCSRFVDMWPPDVQLVGIDIVKFHAIYWPAFLMAANLDLPKKIHVHYHWTVDNVKMSKSKGNVVDPMTTYKNLTASGLRYFLLRQGVLDYNCNYSEITAHQYINADLANDIGNCLTRATSNRLNPLQTFPPFHKSVFADRSNSKPFFAGNEEYEFVDSVRKLPDLVDENAENFHFYRSMFDITEVARAANMIIHRNRLWLLDQTNREQKMYLETLMHCIYEGLRVCGILLQPIVPDLADILLNRLGVPKTDRSWDHAKRSFVELDGYNEKLVGKSLGENKMFFKRLKPLE